MSGRLLVVISLENGSCHGSADRLLDAASGIGSAAEDVSDQSGNLEHGVNSGKKDDQQNGNLGHGDNDLPGCVWQGDVERGQHDLADAQQDDVADHGIETVLDERLEPAPEEKIKLGHQQKWNQDRANNENGPQSQ